MKVISFDADGTLVDHCFVDIFWEKEVPKLYAKRHGISFNEAWEEVRRCYNKIGEEDIRWYLPSYWFKRFELEEKPVEVLKRLKKHVKIFPDSLETIENLYDRYELIVVSNAPREILEIELEEIKDYFSKIYSCTSQFKEVRKNPEVYLKVCKEIKASPKHLVHVGDHYKFDYEVPRSLGIRSFLIDRKNNFDGKEDVLRDMRELLQKI